MTIRATVTGHFVNLECVDELRIEDLDGLFDAFASARKAGPFVVLTDTLAMTSAPRAVISAFSDRLRLNPVPRTVWLGDAVVVSSAAVRFILSTLLVIAPLPTQVKAFDNRSEALAWCSSILGTRQKVG